MRSGEMIDRRKLTKLRNTEIINEGILPRYVVGLLACYPGGSERTYCALGLGGRFAARALGQSEMEIPRFCAGSATGPRS